MMTQKDVSCSTVFISLSRDSCFDCRHAFAQLLTINNYY